MSEPDEEKKANSEVKGSSDGRVLFVMLFLCFIMVIAVVAVNAATAPGFGEPVFIADDIKEGSVISSGVSGPVPSSESAAEISSSAKSESESGEENGAENAQSAPIGINSATSEELQQIPGIGPVTAQKILDYREKQGTITKFEDLLEVNGIGKKTLETIKGYCFID